jgi:DNA-directed RNA polymerase specialized sigma24 family protein
LAAQLSQPVFDGEYLERLLARDPVAEQQFVRHFGELIRMVVLARTRSARLVEDVTQETFLRVLQLLRRQGGLETAGYGWDRSCTRFAGACWPSI